MKKNKLKLVIPLVLMFSLTLSCSDPIQFLFNIKDISFPPTATIDPLVPTAMIKPTENSSEMTQSARFAETDCTVSGVAFSNINVGYTITDFYDGNSLICHTSFTGAHGLSEAAYISILALKPDKLEGAYQEKLSVNTGVVDQANKWNAQPDLPADARDEISFIREDSDGYIFLITREANVQNCINGEGFGVEMINGKYLVDLYFSSCEGDAGTYLAIMQNLQQAALAAIQRVESGDKP